MTEIKKYCVWWDEKESVIRNKAWGDFDENDAEAQAKQIRELIEKRKGKVLVLNDLSEAGKASSLARKIFAELMRHPKIHKQAFVGMKTKFFDIL